MNTRERFQTKMALSDEKLYDDADWYDELQKRIKSLENIDSTESMAALSPKFEQL